MDDITLQGLRSRLNHDVEHAEAVLLRDGALAPFVALTSATGHFIPIVPDFSTPEMKNASMVAMRLLAIAEDAVLASHFSEVWLVVGEPTNGVPPSQSERRIEAVAVVVQGRVDNKVVSVSSVREILRGDHGQPTGLRALGLPGEAGAASLGGPMSELLPPERPAETQRAVARAALIRMGVRPAPE